MPPPKLVAEVVSPGQSNRERDYNRKRAQYSQRQMPEYWIVDPENQVVTVLKLEVTEYEVTEYIQVGTFRGDDRIQSLMVPRLQLTAAEIFQAIQ